MADEISLKEGTVVLIVDDEELMREVTSIMIEDHGGRVYTAIDGLNAVEVFTAHAEEIQCIVMDFSMPRMNGYESLLELRKIDAKVPCIIVSGLAVTPEIERMKDQGELVFMSKPFQEQDLIRAITELVN